MKLIGGAILGFIAGLFVEAAAQERRRNWHPVGKVRQGDPLEGED